MLKLPNALFIVDRSLHSLPLAALHSVRSRIGLNARREPT